MAKISLPYVAWRDGRPRFSPGPRERAQGFASRDLKHGDGRWFTFEEAQAFAIENAKAIAESRTSRGARSPATANEKVPARAAPKSRTIEDLLIDWHASDAVQSLEPRTIEGYRRQIDAIVFKPGSNKQQREPFATTSLPAIGKPEVVAFIEYQKRARGHHMALASRAVLSAAFTWGESSTRWRLTSNPASRLRFKRPAGRIVIYTIAEIRALLAAADALGRPSIGDAIMLGLFTGQRQGDRLALADAGLQDGRRIFRQNKTQAVVAIPETPELKLRLEAARARVAAIKLKFATRPEAIVVDETTGREWNEHTYRHVFAEVRAMAVRGSNEFALAPCPSLEGKRDQDLRDTAVTWLARAGCTPPMIGAITGHSQASIHGIMKHYLAITPELADAAIGKLVAWMTREGMAV